MKITGRRAEKSFGVVYNWLTLDSGDGEPPDTCGCEDARTYPPERTIEFSDYGWIKRIVFLHRNGESSKRCCAALLSKSKSRADIGPWEPMTSDDYRKHYQLDREDN